MLACCLQQRVEVGHDGVAPGLGNPSTLTALGACRLHVGEPVPARDSRILVSGRPEGGAALPMGTGQQLAVAPLAGACVAAVWTCQNWLAYWSKTVLSSNCSMTSSSPRRLPPLQFKLPVQTILRSGLP